MLQAIYQKSVKKLSASILIRCAARSVFLFEGIQKFLYPDTLGIGWYASTIGLTGLFASIIAGQLWDKINHASVFIYRAFFGLIGMFALLVLVTENNKLKSEKNN